MRKDLYDKLKDFQKSRQQQITQMRRYLTYEEHAEYCGDVGEIPSAAHHTYHKRYGIPLCGKAIDERRKYDKYKRMLKM